MKTTKALFSRNAHSSPPRTTWAALQTVSLHRQPWRARYFLQAWIAARYVPGSRYLALRQQTRSFGRAPQLAQSAPSTRTGVFSRNAIVSQTPAATAHFPLPTFVLTEAILRGVKVWQTGSL